MKAQGDKQTVFNQSGLLSDPESRVPAQPAAAADIESTEAATKKRPGKKK